MENNFLTHLISSPLSPYFIIMYIIFGLISILKPFSFVFVAVCIALFYILDIVSLKFKLPKYLIFGLSLLLLWSSLIFSYHPLPNISEDIYKPIAFGGFPLKAFEYPHPPMGSDIPPVKMWLPFYGNLIFWIIISFIIVRILPRKIFNEWALQIILLCSIMISLYGLGYITIKFD